MHLPPPPLAREVVGELRVVDEIAALHQHQEVAPLLVGDRAEADPPVGGGLDRRDLDRPSVRRRRAAEARDHRRERRHREVNGLEHGEIDVLAPAGAPRAGDRGERADRGVAAGEPLAEAPARGERRPLDRAAGRRRPRPCLDRELRRRSVAPWPGPAEPRHRDERRRRIAPGHRRPVHSSHALDDDVRIRDEVQQRGAPVGRRPVDRDAALRRVEEAKEHAVLARRQLRAGGRPAPHGIATRRLLHLDDIGPGVGEQLRGVRRRDVGRELDDAEPRERRSHGSVSGM